MQPTPKEEISEPKPFSWESLAQEAPKQANASVKKQAAAPKKNDFVFEYQKETPPEEELKFARKVDKKTEA